MALTSASNDEATMNGTRIDFIRSYYSEHAMKEDRIVVLKPSNWFDQYPELFVDHDGRAFNCVELAEGMGLKDNLLHSKILILLDWKPRHGWSTDPPQALGKRQPYIANPRSGRIWNRSKPESYVPS